MIQNRKAQLGVIMFLVFALIAMGVFYVALSPTVAGLCSSVQSNGITGLDGWMYCNINLIVSFVFILILIVIGVAATR